MEKMKFADQVDVAIEHGKPNRNFSPFDFLNPKGKFLVEIIRKNGEIENHVFENAVCNEGKNHILGVEFHSTTQITTWYIGLMDSAGYTSNPVTDTAASHSGWAESTIYSEAVRQAWGAGAPSSQSITNASPAVFSINGTGTLKGIFVTSSNVKGGSAGFLWSSGLFSSDLAVGSGDSVKITYTLST